MSVVVLGRYSGLAGTSRSFLYRTWNAVTACLQPGCTSSYEQITLKQLPFVWIHTTQLV